MIHPDDYVIGPPAQSKIGSQLVPHPPNSNLSSDLTSARTQMTAQISTHLHLRSWIHSSNPHQPRSPHELNIHPNMRAQSLKTVGPPANHSCELGGSGDSHRHLVVLLLHLIFLLLMVLGPPRALLGGGSGNQQPSRNLVMMKMCCAK